MTSAPRGIALVFVAAVVLASCSRKGDDSGSSGSSAGGVDAGTFDKPALLRAFGECAFAGYKEFQGAAVELEAATRRAETEGTVPARDAAREAWRKAIDAWQRVEVYGFGPAAMTGSPGAKDLRDPIYSWPLTSRCLAEQTLVAKTYDTPDFKNALVSTRGLSVQEYLLFYDPSDNACTPTTAINTQGTWSALGAPEIAKRKLAYARAIAVDTVQRGQLVVDAWDPAKENFLGELANAGQSKTFTSQQMAFNAVSDALFYADAELKDMKVGKPAGLVPECVTPPCLADVESPYAKRSKEHLRNNLIGLDRLLRGCGAGGAGLGFDDLLRAIGADAVANKLETTFAAVVAALDALKEPTFEDDIVKNGPGVKALFDALRAFSSVLKTEMLTVLDLEIPKKVEGDND